MRKRLERFGEVGVGDETNGFGTGLLQEDRERISVHNSRRGSSTHSKEEKIWF